MNRVPHKLLNKSERAVLRARGQSRPQGGAGGGSHPAGNRNEPRPTTKRGAVALLLLLALGAALAGIVGGRAASDPHDLVALGFGLLLLGALFLEGR